MCANAQPLCMSHGALQMIDVITSDYRAGHEPTDVPCCSQRLTETLAVLFPEYCDGRVRALLQRLQAEVVAPGLQHGQRSFPFPLREAALSTALLAQTGVYFQDVLNALTITTTSDAEAKIVTLQQSSQRWRS